jgi:hypothetical protein
LLAVLLAKHQDRLGGLLGDLTSVRTQITSDIDAFTDNYEGICTALNRQLATASTNYDHAYSQFRRKFPYV